MRQAFYGEEFIINKLIKPFCDGYSSLPALKSIFILVKIKGSLEILTYEASDSFEGTRRDLIDVVRARIDAPGARSIKRVMVPKHTVSPFFLYELERLGLSVVIDGSPLFGAYDL